MLLRVWRRQMMVGAAAREVQRRGRLLVGESRFRELRESGAAYVDKTALIDDMIATDHRFVLCRPPLFGKTTTVTLLKELFSGHKYLFDGSVGGSRLHICDTPWDWAQDVHEVIHIDLKAMSENPATFRRTLLDWMADKTESLGGTTSNRDSLKSAVRDLIHAASEASPSGRCVVLVDNYDAPIRQGDPLKVSKPTDLYLVENAQVLSDWISGMRAESVRIRFQFFAGVYKVRLNVFDTAVDLSVSNRFSPLCGFTRRDLVRNFGDAIDELAERLDYRGGRDEALDALEVWYGGYRWGDVPEYDQVHCPYAVLRALMGGQLRPYWSESIILPEWVRNQLRDGSDKLVRDAVFGDDRFNLPDSYDAATRWETDRSGTANALVRDQIRLQFMQLGLLTCRHVDYDPTSLLRIARLETPNRDAHSVMDRLLSGPGPSATSASPLRNQP